MMMMFMDKHYQQAFGVEYGVTAALCLMRVGY